jgi:hypothetical protein
MASVQFHAPMLSLFRVVLTILSLLVGVAAAWLALTWGLAHYSFETPLVASCHLKNPEIARCLTESVRAVVWHNIAPAAWRFLLIAGAGWIASRSILRFRDSLVGYRW